MKALRTTLALALGLACLGCAKFPPGTGVQEFTRVTFRMRVAGKINTTQDDDPSTQYLYVVAIRASNDVNPDPQLAPVPVVAPNNPNGRVAGSPTHFVEFDTLTPNSSEPFVLYRFSTQEEVPNPSDPTNPINLASFARSNRGRIINFQDLDQNPAELRFDLFINQLADTDDLARQLNSLQVNFLTMSRLSTGAGGERIIDSIGDNTLQSEFNQFIKVDLRTDGILSNSTGITQGVEPRNDTYRSNEPDLDIIDWSIEVRKNG